MRNMNMEENQTGIPEAEVWRHGYRVDERKLATSFTTNVIEACSPCVGTGAFLHIVRDDVVIYHRLNHFCQRRRRGDQHIGCGHINLYSMRG